MLFKKIALFIGIAVAGMPLHVQAQFSPAENEKLAIGFSFIAGGFFTAAVGCFYRSFKAHQELKQSKKGLIQYLTVSHFDIFKDRCKEFNTEQEILKKYCKAESLDARKKYFADYQKTLNIDALKQFLGRLTLNKMKLFLSDTCCCYEIDYSRITSDNLCSDLKPLYQKANRRHHYNKANKKYLTDYFDFNVSLISTPEKQQENIDKIAKEKGLNPILYNLVHSDSRLRVANMISTGNQLASEHLRNQAENKRFYYLAGGMGCMVLGAYAWKNVIDIYHAK